MTNPASELNGDDQMTNIYEFISKAEVEAADKNRTKCEMCAPYPELPAGFIFNAGQICHCFQCNTGGRCTGSVMHPKYGCRRCSLKYGHAGDCDYTVSGPFDKPWEQKRA